MTTLAELENRIYDHSLKLYVPLSYMDGLAGGANISSKDAYGTPFTITGAYWTPLGWVFDGTDDYLGATIANTDRLDFTFESFSGIVRCTIDTAPTAIEYVINRGSWNARGWTLAVDAGIDVRLYTWGATDAFSEATARISVGEKHTLGWSRQGTSVQVFVDGVEHTDIAGSHGDPTANAVNSLGIGAGGTGTSPAASTTRCIAIWARWLAPTEHMELHQMMKEVFP